MSNRFFIGIGVAFLAVFAFGIAAVVSVNSVTNRVAASAPAAAVPLVEATPLPSSESEVQAAPVASPARPTVQTAASSPVAPVTVQDSDLIGLAAAVKLGQVNTDGVGKDVWARETPVAEKLLQGLCDCDQRNWLKHFVKTGHEALSGSENYYQSIQELATLRRSNQEVTTIRAP